MMTTRHVRARHARACPGTPRRGRRVVVPRTLLRRRGGFTLIEVMAVVVLIGLLAGAAAWSMAGTVQHATRTDALDVLAHADATARVTARRLGPSTLRIDLDRQRLQVVAPPPGSKGPQAGPAIKLPAGFRVQQVSWVDTAAFSPGQAGSFQVVEHGDGVVGLAFSSAGLSRSYALKLVGPGRGLNGETQQVGDAPSWLLVCGLTGQTTVHDDAETIDKLFELLASARADAG